MPLPLIDLAPDTPRHEHDADADRLVIAAGFFTGLARALFLIAMAALVAWAGIALAAAAVTLVGG